jgi:predicted dithiol-disulfide oxidoreductase (DUF899 family)
MNTTPTPATTGTRPAVPPIAGRDAWLTARNKLLTREKAHTRECDAIAAARRRLPMTEVDANAVLVGPQGPTPFIDLFQGREQLIAYKHMWHSGEPIQDQCPGCTLSIWNVQDVSYLHARGVAFAVCCEGPWDEVGPFVDFMGYTVPWYSTHGVSDEAVAGGLSDDRGLICCYLRVGERVYLTNDIPFRGVEAIMPMLKLLDMTVFGRQESWEDSPAGWPQPDDSGSWWSRDGRPVAQWTRPGATRVNSGG